VIGEGYLVDYIDFCVPAFGSKMHDSCLELSKIEVLKMLDLQTKSAIK
jgi:hypothetical protein